MPPNGYRITEPVPGFAAGDILNVTERYRHFHRDRLELERIGATPGTDRVVVRIDEPTGFSKSNVLDATARFGDWHRHSYTFDAGEAAPEVDDAGPTCITMATLRSIADPRSG